MSYIVQVETSYLAAYVFHEATHFECKHVNVKIILHGQRSYIWVNVQLHVQWHFLFYLKIPYSSFKTVKHSVRWFIKCFLHWNLTFCICKTWFQFPCHILLIKLTLLYYFLFSFVSHIYLYSTVDLHLVIGSVIV